MQQAITAIADKHGIDLKGEDAHITLLQESYQMLSIENIGFNCVSVAHYFESAGDLVADPDVVFFIGGDGYWVPLSFQNFMGYKESAAIAHDEIEWCNDDDQHDLAAFCEIWGQNIIDQRWLDQGRVKSYQQAA